MKNQGEEILWTELKLVCEVTDRIRGYGIVHKIDATVRGVVEARAAHLLRIADAWDSN